MEEPLDDELLRLFPESARPEIVALAEAARIASRETFGPFNDTPESEFYEAEGFSPQETWERLAESVAVVGARAVVLALAGRPLSPDLICDLHRRIFGELFPDWAGRLRGPNDPVMYGIVIGTPDRPEYRERRGTDGRRIERRLIELCDEFNGAAAEFDAAEVAELNELLRPAVKAYSKLLSTHPFIDGNGRVAFLVLQFVLIRIGLVAIALPDYEAHQRALGQALRADGKQTYVEFERLLADTLRASEYDPRE
jgi:fido (protein-threonine AMPylation protein)